MLSRIAVREPPYSAPTYEQMRTRIASFAGSLIVIVVRSAITSVAERPGRMPTMMPSSAPPRPRAIEVGFMKPTQAWARSASPENIVALDLWQSHQEQLLEDVFDDDARADADGDGEGDVAPVE